MPRGIISGVAVLMLWGVLHAKEGPMNVKHENGKVWIDNVPALAWGKSGETTFCGALAAAMRAMDIQGDYVGLMGDSALAFRVRWYRSDKGQGWCPSSPVGEMGPWDQRASKAAGLKLSYRVDLEGKTDFSQYANDVKKNIDAGRPVLAYGTTLDLGVIYGYADEGRTVMLRDYFKGETPVEMPLKDTKGMLVFIDRAEAPASDRDRAVQAMKDAVADWRRAPDPMKQGRYLFGDAALAEWIGNLRSAELTEAQRKELFQPSWWTFCALADARRAAASYLQRVAPLFEGEAYAAILKAASLYEQSAGLTGKVFADKNAFLGPWSGKKIDDWDEATRLREAELLSQVRTLDNQAIAEMEKALKAL